MMMRGYAGSSRELEGDVEETIMVQEAEMVLDEVVVIGYGTLSRSKVIGAVSSIGSEDIGELPA